MRERDDEVLATANAQFGLITSRQLRQAGVSTSAISRSVASGRLTRRSRGVYAVGLTALTRRGWWLAAVWGTGERAWLSHTSAAAFHELRPEQAGEPIHVSTTANARSRPGVVVHRVAAIEARDLFRPHPLVVSGIPRTVIELADVLGWPDFRACADRLPYLRLNSIRSALERAPNRMGAPLVRRLLEADEAHTKSELERRYLLFARSQRLPCPDRVNGRLSGHTADCVYERERLVIELDGKAFHRRRDQMRKDRRRDIDYQVAGHRIARLVWDDLHPDAAAETAEMLRRLLVRRR